MTTRRAIMHRPLGLLALVCTLVLSGCEREEFPEPPSSDGTGGSAGPGQGYVVFDKLTDPYSCAYWSVTINGMTATQAGLMGTNGILLDFGTYPWTAYESSGAGLGWNCGRQASGNVTIVSGTTYVNVF